MAVDDDPLRREIEAVREASRAGEIVAVTPDDGRSLARHVTRATVRMALFITLAAAATFAILVLF